MAITYRAAKRTEEPEIMKLWTDVFKVPSEFFQAMLDSIDGRKLGQTRVAVDGDRIVSAVQYFIRPMRGLAGNVFKVGGIANVATYEDARGQGHSGALLQQAIKEMEKEGCEWSMLFTGVNPHYEKHGWKTQPWGHRTGALTKKSFDGFPMYRIEKLGNRVAEEIPNLCKVYDYFNANRPLSMVRSQRCWKHATYYRMHPSCCSTLVARPLGRKTVSAYVVTKPDSEKLSILEAACIPGQEAALVDLFDQLRKDCIENHTEKFAFHLPSVPCINEAVEHLVDHLETVPNTGVMIRPLGGKITEEGLQAVFQAPGAHFWPLDDF